MTTEQLLIPRYEVILDYPYSKFKVGKILTLRHDLFAFPVLSDNMSNKPNAIGLGHAEKYPNIFRPISWWEKREISDLPIFVKILPTANSKFKDNVYRIIEVQMVPNETIFKIEGGYRFDASEVSPSTKEEYKSKGSLR